VQCAWAATRKKQSYLQAQFHRLRARRGAGKAICAVAASILTAIYHMLKDGTVYQDLGPDHFQHRSKDAQTRRLVRSLEHLGFAMEIKECVAWPEQVSFYIAPTRKSFLLRFL
jgi:transposase